MNIIDHDKYLTFSEGKKIRNQHYDIIQILDDENIKTQLNYINSLCNDIFYLYKQEKNDIENSSFQMITKEYIEIMESYKKLLKLRRKEFIDQNSIKEKILLNTNEYTEIFERIFLEKTKTSKNNLKNISNKIQTLIQVEQK